jgi:arsenical pump membrane protein
LTFTPPICIFARKAKISPLPFLLGEFVAANTWSMTLIVGNPTNVYLASSVGLSFMEYLSVMFLPAILGGITGLVMITLLFRKDLLTPVTDFSGNRPITSPDSHIKVQKAPMIVAVLHLAVCIVLLSVADYLHIEMWLICVVLALSLTAFDLFYDLIVVKSAVPVWRSIKKEPYELIPFVLSMFIIVLALNEQGVISKISGLIVSGEKIDGATVGVLSALSANLLNNIPMSVMFESIIGGSSMPAIFGAVIGSNIGAFITPVGALAGIMWSKILSDYGVKLPFLKFVAYGSAVAIPTLLASIGGLMIIL